MLFTDFETKCREQGLLYAIFPWPNAIIMMAMVKTSIGQFRNEAIRKNGDLINSRADIVAVVRSMLSDHKISSSIPGSAEI